MIQILWLTFISNHKDEWTVLIVLFLQLWISICVFRSRARIRLLTEELYRISNMLHVYTIQKKKMLKIFIWVYCLFVTCVTVFLAVTVFNSGMVAQQQHQLRNSEIVAAHLKRVHRGHFERVLQYFVLLLITLAPAAAVNQAAAMARELVLSLPGWIQAVQHHKSAYLSKFHGQNFFDIVENLSNRQFFAH
ncbi:hypothetical protein CEXT_369261 [Caerostris extrusa]|uniref:Uncharacterized protein n=1 Tax=Caerostris extrusa TaxID=172846 RepID=A0AAV4XGX1_CAEEX|nr:hypothetical protein CEXT_369261 [Caerostris extrusa]